jgi:hypothetical protein
LAEVAVAICHVGLATVTSDEDRGKWLNSLSIHLRETGDSAGALAPIREAVDIRRRLAAQNLLASSPTWRRA